MTIKVPAARTMRGDQRDDAGDVAHRHGDDGPIART